MQPVFFSSPAEFRAWLEANHATESEVVVGFHKRHTDQPSMTWPESVDQALCFGWIDGVRKKIDEDRYQIRFTPRKPKSIWSQINIAKMAELQQLGLMQPAGLKAFEERDPSKQNRYSFENKDKKLDPASEKEFKKNKKAWAFFESQPPSYRRVATWWVIQAAREETRLKRLSILIADSERGERIAYGNPNRRS